MHECSAGLCTAGQHTRRYIVQAFDDGLRPDQSLHRLPGQPNSTYGLSTTVVTDNHCQRRVELDDLNMLVVK